MTTKGYICTDSWFQFQMVRLKGWRHTGVGFQECVSIPNGTIKSRQVPLADMPLS